MKISTIEHNEAVITHFAEDPDFAELYLQTVINDGNEEEIAEVQSWINEAKSRSKNATPEMNYWDALNEHVKIAVKSGLNLGKILARLNEAVSTVKAAMA